MGRHGGRAHFRVFWSSPLLLFLGPAGLGRAGSRQGGSSRPAGSANDAWSPYGPRARKSKGQVKAALPRWPRSNLCGGGVGLIRCGSQSFGCGVVRKPCRRLRAAEFGSDSIRKLSSVFALASSASSSTPLLPTLASRGVSTAPPSVQNRAFRCARVYCNNTNLALSLIIAPRGALAVLETAQHHR